MQTILPVATGVADQPGEAHAAKAVRAAKEFEAVLLNSLFGSLERAFAALPGKKKEDSSSDTYHAMGMQALTSSLANWGGIGIAAMIERGLLKHEGTVAQGAEGHSTKVSAGTADIRR